MSLFFKKPRFMKSIFRRTIRSVDEFQMINISGVDDFSFEAQHKGETIFGFACDEGEGPISVYFGPLKENVEIRLSALRELLDDAEAKLLKERSDYIDPLDW